MKKFTAAMLTMALAGAMLTGCGSTASNTTADDSAAKDNTAAAATDGGTLRMGTNATFPPYEFVGDDGSVQGIDADIAAAIADKLGMKVEITDMEFDSLIPALQSDTIDVALAGMTVRRALISLTPTQRAYRSSSFRKALTSRPRTTSRVRTSAFRPAPPATSTAPTTTARITLSSSITVRSLSLLW